MTGWRRGLQWALASALLMTLPGCWDYEKINARASVIGIGVDPLPNDPDRYHFIFQIPDYAQGNGSGGSSEESASEASSTKIVQNVDALGYSVAEAVAIAQQSTHRTIFLGNLQTIILNTQLSGPQVRNLVTELVRLAEPDKLSFIVGTDQSAEKVLDTKESLAPADIIDRFHGDDLRQYGYFTRTQLWEFWRNLTAIGITPCMGLIDANPKGIRVNGSWVFTRDAPAGILTPEETFAVNLTLGDVQHMTAEFEQDGHRFVIGNLRDHSRLNAYIENGKPHLTANVHVYGVLDHVSGASGQRLTDAQLHQFESAAAQEIRNNMQQTLAKLQSMHADVYGFGRFIFIHQPQLKNWLDRNWIHAFADAQPEFNVHVELDRKATLM